MEKLIVGEKVEQRETEEEILEDLKQQYGGIFTTEDATEESQKELEKLLENLEALKTKDKVEERKSEDECLPDLINIEDDTV